MEQNRPTTPSPIEQLKQLSATSEKNWLIVIEDLRKATFECIEVSNDERVLLETNFWEVHSHILGRAEVFEPGVTEKIFKRFEQLAAERRSFEMIAFEEETLPAAKRSAFWRRLIGLPPKEFDL